MRISSKDLLTRKKHFSVTNAFTEFLGVRRSLEEFIAIHVNQYICADVLVGADFFESGVLVVFQFFFWPMTS